MIVYDQRFPSRGEVGSNPGRDHYVYVRPETEEEERQLQSCRSGVRENGDGTWRLSRETVKHVGGRPMYGGLSDAYRSFRALFAEGD